LGRQPEAKPNQNSSEDTRCFRKNNGDFGVEKMKSIEELKQDYGDTVTSMPLYGGDCLVIPGTEFNPDWEAELGDQGFRCHFGSLNNRAVTFVQLKKAVAPGKVVYVPPKMPESAVNAEVQSNMEVKETTKTVISEEKKEDAKSTLKKSGSRGSNTVADEYIVELWKGKKSYEEIKEAVKAKFAGEKISVDYRIQMLLNSKRIYPRGKKVNNGTAWKKPEETRLMKRFNEVSAPTNAEKIRLIQAEFPERNVNSLTQKIMKLKKNPSASKSTNDSAATNVTQATKVTDATKATENLTSEKSIENLSVANNKKTPEKFVGLLSKAEDAKTAPAKYATFEDIWAAASKNEYSTLKDIAEDFYLVAVEAKLPEPIITSVLSCFEELYALCTLCCDQIGKLQTFTAQTDAKVKAVHKEFIVHKHAEGSREAMLPPAEAP
jgi:hypothetical protein